MKSNYLNGKYKKLSSHHFNAINDDSYIVDVAEDINLIEKLRNQYQENLLKSHSNQFQLLTKKLIYC